MEDISDCVFRSLCHNHGADLTFTEMVRMDGLARNNKCTWQRTILKSNTPAVIQLLGSKEQYLKKFLSRFRPSEGFKGFNLNLGCPSPNIIAIGQGCAMVKRVAKTKKLVMAVKKEGYNVSIKMRLGLNRLEKRNKVYINLLNNVRADFFVVHSRYGLQTYDSPADDSVYEECVDTGKDIIANGDIETIDKVTRLRSMGVKGVMIGRAAVVNPSIFDLLKGNISSVVDVGRIKEEYAKINSEYGSVFRYRKNFFAHVGKKETPIDMRYPVIV